MTVSKAELSLGHDEHEEAPTVSALSEPPAATQHTTLKYSLLGPPLTKPGQDGVDQKKVSEIIYEASKGSKFFQNEENRDKNLTVKISRILAKKRDLERIDGQGGLKNELKRADEYVSELECGRDLSQIVVHVDCDAFYAAVEELDRPELKDVPFAVGMGVLTTCNYEARKFGCRSGMAGFVADKLCPQLIHLPLNFEKYSAKAHEVRAVLQQYDPRFESASIDEAYLNITQYCEDHSMEPEAVVQQMRDQVYAKAKITVSAGIAVNAKLAKICSNQNKPNGQFRLASSRSTIMVFMRDLPTRKVNGIGTVFERQPKAVGVETCGDIYPIRHYLSKLFGEKAYQFLIMTHLGLGRTSVRPAEEFERKSVGTESTFHDISDPRALREKLRWTAEELEKDLKRTEFKGRTLVLKIKLHTYEVISRQVQPPKAVGTADDLYHFSLPMLAKLEKELHNVKLRLMGLRCTHLVSTKKGETDFFGRARQHSRLSLHSALEFGKPDDSLDQDGWQVWPDEEFEVAARLEREDDARELEQLSQEHTTAMEKEMLPHQASHISSRERRYGNGFAWRAVLEEERAKSDEAQAREQPATGVVDQWNCPICSLPQAPDERVFNEHIDACLSRQAIKEIVRTSKPEVKSSTMRSSGGDASGSGKRKRAGRRETEQTSKRAFFA